MFRKTDIAIKEIIIKNLIEFGFSENEAKIAYKNNEKKGTLKELSDYIETKKLIERKYGDSNE